MYTLSRFPKWLNLITLERSYGLGSSIEVTTMDRILHSESQHQNLRDLPSFFSCSTGLLSQLKDQLESPDLVEVLLNEAIEFGSQMESQDI